MAKLNSAQWQNMMDYLRSRHAPICRQWFNELSPMDIDGGLLRIHTDDTVQCNYLQHKCRQQFTEAAQSVTGKLVTVRFETGKSKPDPLTELSEKKEQTNNNTFIGAASDLTINNYPAQHKTYKPNNEKWLWESPDSDSDQIVLSPDYSFDNFITGPNNQLAAAAAIAVSNQPGVAYNPLFIHGGVGLGKTHLLQAICQQILIKEPQTKILYVSCDAFMNQFISCVQSGKMNEFRHRYRNVDLLVIDDIHFLGNGNRERSQEELFHTFNDMYQSGRQIVLSSDAAPNEIPHLEQRLLSRFQWGLVAMVAQPHYETRVAILRAKAKLREMEIPDEVIAYIATKVDSNARELEGAIITLQGHATLGGKKINMDLARDMLGDNSGGAASNQVTLERIIESVVGYYGVKLSDLQSKRRSRSITEPRQICMWLARKHTRFSLEEIGGYFGGRDHTTVMHSIKAVDNHVEQEEKLAEQVALLDKKVQNLGG